MKRAILLLDGQCSPCSEVGRQIQVEGLTEDSILEIGSLHDPRYREMVDRVRPNGKLEPTLLHLDGPAVSASTGVKLVASLMRIVGLRRSFRIAQLVREATADPAFDPSRRSFLIKAAGAAAVLPLAGVLGVKSASATEEETAQSPLTLVQAQAAYALLLRSDKYRTAHQSAVADGVRHQRSGQLRAEEGVFVGSTCLVLEINGKVSIMLSYVDSQGPAPGYFMQAVVDIDSKKVLTTIHVDASDVVVPVIIPASSVTAGLANVRGVVHNSIEARTAWSVARDGVDVPVELIRIVPGVNLVEVDENAELATTTHGLSGLEITITQTDGTNTHSVNGSIGPANLALITDGALDSLVAGRETTVYIGPPVAAPPAARSGPAIPPAPAGTLRLKGQGVDLAITNGVWTGTPVPTGARAIGTRDAEEIFCGLVAIVHCTLLCTLFTGFVGAVICGIVCGIVWLTVCYLISIE